MSERSGKLNFEIGQDATRADIGQDVGKRSVDGTSALKPDSGSTKSNGQSDLSNAEKAASDKTTKVDRWSDLGDVKDAEESAGGLYSGIGKEAKKPKPVGFRGVAMRGGPFFAILFVVFIIGGIMTGTQTMQPFSLIAQFEETYNSMRVSASLRSEVFFKNQMRNRKDIKSPYSLFGTDFSISKKQQEKLREKGIEYDDDYDGKKVLKYTNENGDEIIITSENFKEVYTTDNEFFQKYNAASMTWRGAIANWFGTNVTQFLKNNKLTRNLFEKYEEKLASMGADGKNATPEQRKKAVVELIKERIKGDSGVKMKSKQSSDEESTEYSTSSGKPKNGTEVKQKVMEIADMSGSGMNIYCGAFNAIGAINLMVTADQALQIINLTTALFEAVDKTKAGLGTSSPIMVFSDALNERVRTENVALEKVEGADHGLESIKVIRNKTAMESASIAGIYGGNKVNPNDPSVASFNIASNTNKVLGGFGKNASDFEKCSVARIGAAIVSLGTGGLIGSLGQAAFSVSVAVLVDFLVPTVASAMMRDIVSDLAGEDVGNAFVLGANMYLGSVHRANGGSLSTIDKYKQFAVSQNQVIADNARYERMSLSPFDITSKYTFMGTIMHQLSSFTHANSVMSTLSAGGSAVSSSLMALNGTASAYDVAENLPDSIDEYAAVNPNMAWIRAIGDWFGYQYVITDVSTMNSDPIDPINEVDKAGGFSGADSNGNPIIDGDSDLAKFIRSCGQRQSSFGMADQNIAGEVAGTFDVNTSNSSVNAAVNTAIGMIPYVGDIIDIIQGTEELAYSGYISGESCVAGNEVDADLSPSWSKAKWYQRFIEDQSLAESMGLIEKSAVTAYLEDYYKEHPLDNSYEGILARYSGMTKDNVIALLDYIEYADYIAHYDPSTRYAFGAPAVKPSSEIFFEKENVMSGDGILLGVIVYADVRNRSFAV